MLIDFFRKRPRKFNNQEQIDRAVAVKALLEHPLLVEFFERAEEQIFDRFLVPELTDEQVIELHRQAQALDGFRHFFQKVLTDGKMAEKEKQAAE